MNEKRVSFEDLSYWLAHIWSPSQTSEENQNDSPYSVSWNNQEAYVQSQLTGYKITSINIYRY